MHAFIINDTIGPNQAKLGMVICKTGRGGWKISSIRGFNVDVAIFPNTNLCGFKINSMAIELKKITLSRFWMMARFCCLSFPELQLQTSTFEGVLVSPNEGQQEELLSLFSGISIGMADSDLS